MKYNNISTSNPPPTAPPMEEPQGRDGKRIEDRHTSYNQSDNHYNDHNNNDHNHNHYNYSSRREDQERIVDWTQHGPPPYGSFSFGVIPPVASNYTLSWYMCFYVIPYSQLFNSIIYLSI